MMALRRPLAAALVGLAVCSLAACGSSGSRTKASSSTTAASASGTGASAPPSSAAPSSVPTGGAAGTTPPPAAKSSKVNANAASQTDLATAFQSVGVPNADRWAKEVDEYKPYPNDPMWAKLRQELGKYNIAPDTLAKILSVLEV
jgi:hypothetical protein